MSQLILTSHECKLLYDELCNQWLNRDNYHETKPLLEKLYRIGYLNELNKSTDGQASKDIQDKP